MLPINKTISMIERHNLEYRNAQFKQFKLKGYQASFLIEISKYDFCPMEKLIETMHVDKSTITRGIQACEDLGYVNVTASSHDRRYKLLSLTSLGIEVKEHCVAVLKKQRQYLMQDFDENSETQFLSYLEILYRRAKELTHYEDNL